VPVANIQSDKADPPAKDSAGSRLSAKRAAKAAKKAASRGTTNPVEEVAKTVRVVNAWIDDHGKKVWYGLAGVAVLVVIGLAVNVYRDSRDRDAGEILRGAISTSAGVIVPPDETPPEDPLFPTFSSVKERDEKALAQFRDVQKKFPSSRAARYALLGEANALIELGKPVEAAAAFNKLLQDDEAGDDNYLRFRGLEGAGYALEGQQKYEDARKRFAELSKLRSGAYRTLGDYHQARMLVLEGKRAEARTLLEAASKAAADKPAEQEEHFESVAEASSTLLSELGGTPAEKPGGKGTGISQNVMDALRRQLATQQK
jgi:tetratricopeptide (TPR) repeat protein